MRYAQPPIDELRFAEPVPPPTNRSQIQDGSYGFSCYQAIPDWGRIASQFVPDHLEGKPINASTYKTSAPNFFHIGETPMGEDCLFLDVYVPHAIYPATSNHPKSGRAPVLVWIFGGGYAFGSKEYWGDPATLIQSSMKDDSEGVVFIAINYRV